LPPSPSSTLSPYTTLFRSRQAVLPEQLDRRAGDRRAGRDRHDEDVVRAVGGVLHEEAEVRDEHDPARLDAVDPLLRLGIPARDADRKSTRLNSSHQIISYA